MIFVSKKVLQHRSKKTHIAVQNVTAY